MLSVQGTGLDGFLFQMCSFLKYAYLHLSFQITHTHTHTGTLVYDPVTVHFPFI